MNKIYVPIEVPFLFFHKKTMETKSSPLTPFHRHNSFFQGRYLSKMFKKYTGLTLRTYILDCRITRAKKLLWEGYNVSEVCYEAGFNDYANFLRSFKKYAGVSPGKYVLQSKTEIIERRKDK